MKRKEKLISKQRHQTNERKARWLAKQSQSTPKRISEEYLEANYFAIELNFRQFTSDHQTAIENNINLKSLQANERKSRWRAKQDQSTRNKICDEYSEANHYAIKKIFVC